MFGSLIEVLSALLMGVLFFWTFYHIPIVVVGIRKALKKTGVHEESGGKLPFVSVIVAAKDEEAVIGRCLESMVRLDYPEDLFEVVIVEEPSLLSCLLDGLRHRILLLLSACQTESSLPCC